MTNPGFVHAREKHVERLLEAARQTLRCRQPLGIKRHETADQTAKRGIGMGMDGRVHKAGRRG